jgi:hypothetical protein
MRFDCVHPQVREDKDRGIYVEGLTEHPVDAPDAVLALVHESATNRATCGTSMNRTSSRSHALLLLRVEQWTESTDEAAADLAAIQTGDEALSDRSSVVSASAPRIAVRRGLLSIVDLAGSERVCKSGSEVRLSPPISPPISAQSRPNLACNLGLISPPISPRRGCGWKRRSGSTSRSPPSATASRRSRLGMVRAPATCPSADPACKCSPRRPHPSPPHR